MAFSESCTLNYSDVFYSFFAKEDYVCLDKAVSHYFVYIYSGEMLLNDNGREILVTGGQCVFIRRDHRVSFTKRAINGQDYKSVTLKLNRNFLRQYYQKMESSSIPKNEKPLDASVVVLPNTPTIGSLFLSMVPYFESEIEPQPELIELKMQEGVMALLQLDRRFYPTLFDFTEPWKIDILDFLNDNYMYDLSMEEIASYTGRSLATFKRDFKKVSELSPQKWLMKKRLERAREMIVEDGRKVTEVCFDVGFKNRSHFTTAYKKHFGAVPTADVAN